MLVRDFGTDSAGGDLWHAGDFDGDGKADLMRTRPDFAGAELFRSSGGNVIEDVAGGDWTLPER